LVLVLVVVVPREAPAQCNGQDNWCGIWSLSYDLAEVVGPGKVPTRAELDQKLGLYVPVPPLTSVVAADGVTRLVLVAADGFYHTGDSGQSTWTIETPGPPELTGRLLSVEGTQAGSTITDRQVLCTGPEKQCGISEPLHQQYAIYEAPSTFGTDPGESRVIHITTRTEEPDGCPFTYHGLLYVRRAAVATIPGAGGSVSDWAQMEGALIGAFPGTVVFNAPPLGRPLRSLYEMPPIVGDAIEQAAEKLNAEPLFAGRPPACTWDPFFGEDWIDWSRSAAAAATVVAHGVGGIAARLWGVDPTSRIEGPGQFGNKSRMSSLITIDTPHSSSFLARQVAATFKNGACAAGTVLNGLYCVMLRKAVARFGFDPNGFALAELGNLKLPGYVGDSQIVVSTFPISVLNLGAIIALATKDPKLAGVYAVLSFLNVVPLVPEGDGVVSVFSQRGGLSSTAVAPNTLHAATTIGGFGSVESLINRQRVVNVIWNDDFAPSFPPAVPESSPPPLAPLPAALPPPDLGAPLVVVSSPASGTTVAPGQVVHVVLDRQPGATVGQALLLTDGAPGVAFPTSFPTTIDVTVPLDAAGPFEIFVGARDAAGSLAPPSVVTLNAVPAAALTSVDVMPSPAKLAGPGSELGLTAIGHYADGVDRNVTGLTTMTSADPAVVTTAAGGLLIGVANGDTSVTVQAGAIAVVVPVTVDAALAPRCGNGVVDAGEQCDPARDVSGCCSSACELVECPYGQTIPGKRLLVKDYLSPTRRAITLSLSDPAIQVTSPGGVPTTEGAYVAVYNVNGTGDAVCLALPKAGWRRITDTVFKYNDNAYANGPCKSAYLRNGRFKLKCQAKTRPIDYALDEPNQGGVAVKLARGASVYCARFDGTSVKTDYGVTVSTGKFRATNAPAPADCPVAPIACP
jgi:hypothetical protein